MTDVRQGLSPRGVRVLFGFVVVYLAVGAALTVWFDLPGVAYAAYGVVSWIAGVYLFYRLNRSFLDDAGGTD